MVLVRPVQRIGRFLFTHILVNLYRLYFSLKPKQNGTTRTRGLIAAFINNRQTIHAGIFTMAAMTMFVNISETQAENYIEGTLLNRIITNEFPIEELIIENADSVTADAQAKKPVKYTGKGYLSVQPATQANISEAETLNDLSIALTSSGSALIKQEIATTKIEKGVRSEAIIYIVEPGDTVTSIAQKFDISINTILWENNLSAYSIIRPGKELVILPATGVNHIIARGDTIASISETYQVEPESILEANSILNENDIRVDQVVFIPEGLKPKPKPSITPSAPPVQSITQPRESFADSAATGDFIWPTNSFRITQYYTYQHFGLDIGNKNGEPIYAAADGTVVASSQGSWNGGYGNQIIIDHGNRVHSRYAHTSYNLVSVGDTVTQGQAIAAIGSSGRSTGPHIHFEIEINGRRVNPLNYLSR